MNEILVVLTKETIEDIRKQRGTASWKLDAKRARRCVYALCVRNSQQHRHRDCQPHGSAFMLGKIGGVEFSSDPKYRKRYLVRFTKFIEYPTPVPNAWRQNRNPVAYIKLDDLVKIISRSQWKLMPSPH